MSLNFLLETENHRSCSATVVPIMVKNSDDSNINNNVNNDLIEMIMIKN